MNLFRVEVEQCPYLLMYCWAQHNCKEGRIAQVQWVLESPANKLGIPAQAVRLAELERNPAGTSLSFRLLV